MAAKSHPLPCNTPLSKEAAINWHAANSTLAITLLSLVSSTAWFKASGNGSPSGAKSRAISWQCLASTGKRLQRLLQGGMGAGQCQGDRKFWVRERIGGGSKYNTLRKKKKKSTPAAKATPRGSTSGQLGWSEARNEMKRPSKKKRS